MSEKKYGLAVSAVINDENNRFLLLKRAHTSKHFAGQWETPGGKIDPGETIDEALIREVKEETGLTITVTGIAGASEFELPTIKVALLHMKANSTSQDVQLSDEHEEFAWISLPEFEAKDLCPKIINYSQWVH